MSNNRYTVLNKSNDSMDKVFKAVQLSPNKQRNHVIIIEPNKSGNSSKEEIYVRQGCSESTVSDKSFKTVKNRHKKPLIKKIDIPIAVLKQRELRKKFDYAYRIVANGNVENNTTLYVTTTVAHPHQIEALFTDAIERAKNMTEIFGKDFECEVQVNVVRTYTGEYLGYAFVDVTNPKFYYAMIGCNVDGNERAEYLEDPNWVPPKIVKAPSVSVPELTEFKSISWADEDENELVLSPPKIRHELPPLISLNGYEYDQQQREHLQTEETCGTVSVSPAFITPGVKGEYDDCSLYVSKVPEVDYDFLYALFARYARTNNGREDSTHFYPRINIRKCVKKQQDDDDDDTGIFAIVEYAHPYDAAFSLAMLQKVRAKYNGKDIVMPVRYAFKNRN